MHVLRLVQTGNTKFQVLNYFRTHLSIIGRIRKQFDHFQSSPEIKVLPSGASEMQLTSPSWPTRAVVWCPVSMSHRAHVVSPDEHVEVSVE
jgi:hypothetical protein